MIWESELEKWSKPENFWNVRKDRDVAGPAKVLMARERLRADLRAC